MKAPSSLPIVLLTLSTLVLAGRAWCQQVEPSAATDEPRSWIDLYEGVASRLEALEPRIEALEALDGPLNNEEIAEIKTEVETLGPMIEELRNRKSEVSEEGAKQARDESLEIFNRMVVLLEKTKEFAAPEEARDAPQVETMISNFAAYGSLRGRGFVDGYGASTFDDSTSRLGLRGQVDVSKTYQFFGRVEVGTNLVGDLTKFLIGGDPGAQEGSEEVAIPLRLLFVGFEGPQGRVSFGKQWSTYYDVAVFTDQAAFFGGNASGAYAAGTDGGISGTGRADRALQYRFAISQFKFGVQAQVRDITTNNQRFADAWGLSTNYQFKEGVTLGLAFNQVRDGVEDPAPEQSKLGDQAFIVGARWRDKTNYYAFNYTAFRNHEKDDLDRYYSGQGLEIFADHMLTERIGIGGTYNYQEPDGDHPGRYKLEFLSVGGAYRLGSAWRFYLIYKFENSRASDGTPLGRNTLGAAVFYNFSWGFAPF